MLKVLIYEIVDLESAREFLRNHDEPVILTNIKGSTRYYGMRVLDYMFKKLSQEFTHVTGTIVQVDDDHAALLTAIKLGYKIINYTGQSEEAKILLEKNKLPV